MSIVIGGAGCSGGAGGRGRGRGLNGQRSKTRFRSGRRRTGCWTTGGGGSAGLVTVGAAGSGCAGGGLVTVGAAGSGCAGGGLDTVGGAGSGCAGGGLVLEYPPTYMILGAGLGPPTIICPMVH